MTSPAGQRLLALAIPSIIANITTPLMGLVDTAVTGHLGSEVFIASVAIAGSVFNLLYWPMGFLRMGTSGLTAQAYGRADRTAQADSLYRGLLCALTVALLIVVLQRPLLSILLRFIGSDPLTDSYVSSYFSIVVWGAPAVLSTYVMTGWLLGMQSARRQMLVSISINVVNVIASPLLAFGFAMGLKGIAWGTLCAQWVGAIGAALMCRRMISIRPSASAFTPGALLRYLHINSDIFLRTLCLIAVTLWFTREGARQGEMTLAVNALLMQFFILFSYMADGFAYAAEAEIGRLTGRRMWDEMGRCVRLLMKWGLILATAFSIVYFLLGDLFLRLLTDRHGVVAAASDYLPWACTVPLAGFMAFTWDGIYIGATLTRQMLLSMVISTGVFFGIYFWSRPALGNHGLWLAFTVYLLSRGIVQTLLWRGYTRRSR